MTHPCPPNASQNPPSFRSRLLRRLFQDANDTGLFQDPDDSADVAPEHHATMDEPQHDDAHVRSAALFEAYLERFGRR